MGGNIIHIRKTREKEMFLIWESLKLVALVL